MKNAKKKINQYQMHWKKYNKPFLAIILISIFTIVEQVILYPQAILVSKMLLIVIAFTFVIFPFGNSVDSLGIQKTTKLVRLFSLLLLVIAFISIFA